MASEVLENYGGVVRWLSYLFRRAVAIAVGVNLVLLGFLFTQQTAMIFPGASSQGEPWAQVASLPAGAELVNLTTSSGEKIVGVFGMALDAQKQPRADAAELPTLLFFYGNGDYLENAIDLLDRLRMLGVNVFIPEYVGYGMSTGQPSEQGCYETASAAYDYVIGRVGNPARMIVGGWSLGAASAIELASTRPVAALATFSAFTSISDMAFENYWFLPGVTLLIRHNFDNGSKLGSIKVPVFIAHGVLDNLVPPAMAARLEAIAPGPVTRIEVPQVGHNDIFSKGGEPLYVALREFLARV